MKENVFTREELYRTLEQHYKINEIKDVRKRQLYQSNLEEFVEDVYDLSKPVIVPFTEKTTFIFRKRYGVLDEGICQTQAAIGEYLGVSRAAIYEILTKIETFIPQKIKSEKRGSLGFNVFDLFEDKRSMANKPLGELDIPAASISHLVKKGVLTLGDLLECSTRNLFTYEFATQSPVVKCVHNLGLKFIDEIPYKERKKLFVHEKDQGKILNSDINWLNLDHRLEKKLRKSGIKYIKDIYSNNIYNNEVNITLEKLGLEIPRKAAIKQKNKEVKTIVQSMPVNRANFTTRAVNALFKLGITTVEEVSQIIRKDLLSIPYVGTTVYEEILSKVHDCGVRFADELSKEEIETYLSELEKRTDDNGRKILNTALSEIGLSNRTYNALSKNNRKTIKDLILIPTVYLLKIKGLGLDSCQEVIDKVHGYGLLFIDEEIKVRIENGKKASSSTEKASKTVSRYKDLMIEKSLLLSTNEKLDEEIIATIDSIKKNADENPIIKKKNNK